VSAAEHNQSTSDEPYVPASKNIPELTPRAIGLGIVLSVVLAAANAYLGLFAGMTVSASIPAAVISMAVLRALRGGNILENNLVQTAASAGESLVAGVIFTIPAMVIASYWGEFKYWETSLIACFGGLLGVMFTIPLRRALIVEQPLQFPEGVATAEVLKVGERGGAGIRYLVWAGLIGALYKVGASGMKLWQGSAAYARSAGDSIAYVGSNLSPALIAVGYIVGLNIAVLVFLGGALNWWVAIPIFASVNDTSLITIVNDLGPLKEAGLSLVAAAPDAATEANNIWGAYTRYIGVGSMAVGGLWALVQLRSSLAAGIRSGMEAYRKRKSEGADSIPRTERDIPMQWVAIAAAVSVVPLIILFYHFTDRIGVSIFMGIVMLVAGFLFSAVAAYMAGLVGSSNNPISGVTIATVLSAALLLLIILGADNTIGPIAAILIGGTVCCAAAIGGDNMQDLKAGHVVGSTPWKQQLMQIIGVIAAAFAIAPVLSVLHKAYGIGVQVRAGIEPLKAPQASLTESVSRVSVGIEESGLPWTLIFIGMAIAVVVIVIDKMLERRQSEFRMPVLALAVGIYLPLELSVPIFVGGVLAHLAGRLPGSDDARRADAQGGLLFAAGLITGEALAGIALAIPIAVANNARILEVGRVTLGEGVAGEGGGSIFGIFGANMPWPGLVLLGVVMYLLYRSATSTRRNGDD
jgi:putative OPT family oligopeptide transporter